MVKHTDAHSTIKRSELLIQRPWAKLDIIFSEQKSISKVDILHDSSCITFVKYVKMGNGFVVAVGEAEAGERLGTDEHFHHGGYRTHK